MSGATSAEEGNRSHSQGGLVEEICDRFEAALQGEEIGRRSRTTSVNYPKPGRRLFFANRWCSWS